MSYGLVDNKDSIITPSVGVTALDRVTFSVSAVFDTTKYVKKAGHGNRAGRYTELDSGVSRAHAFSSEDYAFLPTSLWRGYTKSEI